MKAPKAAELRERSEAELSEMATTTAGELFQARMSNFTNQLDDTSSLQKRRRLLARVKTELRRREIETLRQQVQQAIAAQAEAVADRK